MHGWEWGILTVLLLTLLSSVIAMAWPDHIDWRKLEGKNDQNAPEVEKAASDDAQSIPSIL